MSEDANIPAEAQMDLFDMLPQTWRTKSGDAFVSAYQMLGISLAQLSPPITLEVNNVFVLMGWLGLPELSLNAEFDFSPDGQVRISLRGGGGLPRRPAPIALFMTESQRADISKINAAQEAVHEVVGLLSVIESLNVVFAHLEDYWLSFDSHELTAFPVLIYNPLWVVSTTLDSASQQRWSAVAALIGASTDRDKIKLSLRWLDDGKRATGIDSFLKIWFALEILAMPNTTNIRPIREALASVYNISVADVDARFGVGRIYGFRGDIVHEGRRPEISNELLKLLVGIYVDVLGHKLGAVPVKQAQSVVDDAGGLGKILP